MVNIGRSVFYERREKMTNEERINSLHNKIRERKRKREKMITGCLCSVNAALFVFLMCIIKQQGFVMSGFSGEYTGAMLFENVGGYVLLAVVAFMLGVGVAVMCVYLSRKNKQGPRDKAENSDSED